MDTETYSLSEAFDAIRSFMADTAAPLPDYVTYDPALTDGDFKVIRETSHDGTLWFTIDRLKDVLLTVLHKTCDKKGRTPPEGTTDIEYTVGPITIETEYGLQDLPAGRFPGQIDTITMPVVARYV
jgi:hypothetical protein